MWQEWTSLQRVFFCVALFFTLVLIVQIILMILGGDDVDDFDGDDFSISDGEGFVLFTIKGLIAFFAVGGWMGFAFGSGFIKPVWTILIAIVSGLIAFFAVSLLVYWLSKLAMSGTMQIENAVGKTAEVYLTIPASCQGYGKITLELQGRWTELEAMTEELEPINTGAKAIVVKTDEHTCYVVKA